MSWGSDDWGGSVWSGEEETTIRRHLGTAKPQVRRNKRIDEHQLRRIYTGDSNLERIQDNFRDAFYEYKELPFGLPTYIASVNTLAKFGDILLINSSSSINVSLQKSTKDDVGKLIIIKNITNSVVAIKIFPYSGGSIDGQSSVTMTTAYGSKTLVCVDKNTWLVI